MVSLLAICGSVPPGAPNDFHRGLIRLGRSLGVPTIVDASDGVLKAALDAGPDLIKPNVSELAEVARLRIRTLGDVELAARKVLARGPTAVLASLGSDGMMLIDQQGAIYGRVSGVTVVNTVGAGDAALAGFLTGLAVGADRVDCLRAALTYASSAVEQETTLFEVDPGMAERTVITPAFDSREPLTEPAQPAIDTTSGHPGQYSEDHAGNSRPDPLQEVHFRT